MSLYLADIWRYPVKSCRGEQLAEAQVEPWGLAGDRRWMIVDSANLIPDNAGPDAVIRLGDRVEVLE
jgi:uncharacterized protein YcbX